MNYYLLFFLTVLTSGCGSSNLQKPYEPKLFVVNVLDKSLYDDCHIKGSINVPFEEFNDWATKSLKDNKIDINDHIIVYCSNYMCTASGYGAKYLTKLGFKNVWAYEAGTAEWFQKGLSVEGACQKPYLKKVFNKPDHGEDHINIITTDDLAKKIENIHI